MLARQRLIEAIKDKRSLFAKITFWKSIWCTQPYLSWLNGTKKHWIVIVVIALDNKKIYFTLINCVCKYILYQFLSLFVSFFQFFRFFITFCLKTNFEIDSNNLFYYNYLFYFADDSAKIIIRLQNTSIFYETFFQIGIAKQLSESI